MTWPKFRQWLPTLIILNCNGIMDALGTFRAPRRQPCCRGRTELLRSVVSPQWYPLTMHTLCTQIYIKLAATQSKHKGKMTACTDIANQWQSPAKDWREWKQNSAWSRYDISIGNTCSQVTISRVQNGYNSGLPNVFFNDLALPTVPQSQRDALIQSDS